MRTVKQKLKKNILTVGSWITIGHHSIVEIMASAGFDWLTIDMEHSAIDLTEAQNLIAHIQANDMEAFVRVGKNEELIIKRVLDAGANGVIIPMVNSRDDALKAIAYTKYPPFGKRGVGLARAQNYGIGFEEYKEHSIHDIVVIAQVEHIDSVDNLEDIITLEGIDAILIGPYDLSGSMGKPGKFEDKDVLEAIKKVETICKKFKKPLGFHVISSDYKEMKNKIADGFTFLAFSIDFLFLGDSVRSEMKKLKS